MKGLLSATLLTMSLSFSVQAQTKSPAPAETKESDALDLKKLDDKYWAAKDTDLSVVQNRTYDKAKRVFVNLGYGVLVNDPSSTGRMTNFAAGYYFSERWGVELSHTTGELSDNDQTEKYKKQFNTLPDYNKFKTYTSVNAIWVPFYAKMSFLDRKIVYFDIQFAAGIGSKQYEIFINPAEGSSPTKSTFGYNFDFTQQLFFSEHWGIRLDLKNQWSKQERKRADLLTGQTEADRPLSDNLVNDSMMILGLTYFF